MTLARSSQQRYQVSEEYCTPIYRYCSYCTYAATAKHHSTQHTANFILLFTTRNLAPWHPRLPRYSTSQEEISIAQSAAVNDAGSFVAVHGWYLQSSTAGSASHTSIPLVGTFPPTLTRTPQTSNHARLKPTRAAARARHARHGHASTRR